MIEPEPADTSSRPATKRRKWPVVLVLFLACIAWAVVAGMMLKSADGHLHSAINTVDGVRATLGQSASSDGRIPDVSDPLRDAGRQFHQATQLLDSPWLSPLDVVPVVGRQLGAVRVLAGDAAGAVGVVSDSAQQAEQILDTAGPNGPDRLAKLRALEQLVENTHNDLARYQPPRAGHLVGPVNAAYVKFVASYDQTEHTLQAAVGVAAASTKLLQGPTTELVVAANNAEMRDGSGTLLDAARVEFKNGQMTIENVVPTTALLVPVGAVTVPPDLQSAWGWLQPGTDWRLLGLTPNFPETATMASQMWQKNTGQSVDGVLELDVVGLRDLLQVTGPVTTESGQTVSADDVEQLLFHDQYAGLNSDGSTANGSYQANAERQDNLGSLTEAVVGSLGSGQVSLGSLGNAMAAAASGRHLMVWSADTSSESDWAFAGVSGGLPTNPLMVGVVNLGGNKLDQYLGISDSVVTKASGGSHTSSAQSTPDRQATTSVSVTVTLSNHTPSGQSPYIAGPFPGLGLTYGEYVGILTVNVPVMAGEPTVVGHTTLAATGTEGSSRLLAVRVDLKPGESTTFEITFDMSGVSGQMYMVPSGRSPSIATTFDGHWVNDSQQVELGY